MEEKVDSKEQAYFFDLYVVPGWRELFDRIVDEEVKLPEEENSRFLDAGCGTGGYAIDLAIRAGSRSSVIGVDSDQEKLALAAGKASVKKVTNVEFKQADLHSLPFGDNYFDFVLGDVSLLPPSEAPAVLRELARVAKKGAPVVMKVSTRGSFDEFFSVYWEALHDLDLTSFSPALESLITERLTVTDAEQAAFDAGLRHVHSYTRNEELLFPGGADFFEAPILANLLIGSWLAILPDEALRRKIRDRIVSIIDSEGNGRDFYVSIKASLITGKK